VTETDVAIIGAGPAGIAAAIAASSLGRRVTIVNDQPSIGGQIWRRDISGRRGTRAKEWLDRVRATTTRTLDGTTVIDARRDDIGHVLTLERDGQAGSLSANHVILATGARELFLPFPGWTLPNVFGVGGMQAMAKGGLDVRGKRIAIAGSGPLLVAVAASLAQRGARVVLLAEQAPLGRMIGFGARLVAAPRLAREAVGYASTIPRDAFRFGTWAIAANGDDRVREVIVTNGRRQQTIHCDVLCVGYGLVPNTELAALIGCDTSSRGIAVDDGQRTSVRNVFAAGECVGVAGVDAALAEGTIAGHVAADALAMRDSLRRERAVARRWGQRLESAFELRAELLSLASAETIICRCEDVRHDAIDASWAIRQAKLYTRVGMGACQGRVCGAALRRIYGWSPDRVRAPIYPTLVSSLSHANSDTRPSDRV
jgi:D-hydroxyproline dehydrogenase subunit alpha